MVLSKNICISALGALLSFAAQQTATASVLPANTLWYNGDGDGNNTFVNQDNNAFTQVLFNDFNVPTTWTIGSVWSNDIFSSGPPLSTNATWQIRTMPDGALVAGGDGPATLTLTGFTIFGLSEYMVEVSGLNVVLAPGTYWLAVYADDTNGDTSGNETTSGGNAVGTPPGNNGNLYVSQDHNSTFFRLGLDTSAGIAGPSTIPEPGTLPLLGSVLISGLLYLRRRRA